MTWNEKRLEQGLCGRCGRFPVVEENGKKLRSCEKCRGRKVPKRPKVEGFCSRCGLEPAEENYKQCSKCRLECLHKSRKAVSEGLCANCKCRPATSGKRCQKCVDMHYAKRWKNKREVLEAYGGCFCECCGETEISFLSIDHIDGGGTIHRKAINKSGSGFYIWLRNEGFPSGYQVLCMNCQFGKRAYGVCPHKKMLHQPICGPSGLCEPLLEIEHGCIPPN